MLFKGCGQPAGRQVGGSGQYLVPHCSNPLAVHHGTVEPSTQRPKQLISIGDVQLADWRACASMAVHLRVILAAGHRADVTSHLSEHVVIAM